MQRIFSLLTVICLTLTLSMVSFEAEARRFGGGGSFGRMPTPSRSVMPNRAANTPKSAPKPANFGRNWAGPLMGFMAGGLLASLLMGGGFSGINFFDILIIGLVIFFIMQFLKRRAQPAPQKSPHDQANGLASFFGNNTQDTTKNTINAPTWFNADNFLEAARQHFLALQGHWDTNEMDKIAEYVTPEMFDFLKKERANLGDAYQSTYIDDLQVTLDGVEDNPYKTIASITFTGIEKSSRFDQGEPFSESWRMEREQGQDKPWLVAGIRQNTY